MSLNQNEVKRTGEELRAYFATSGLSREDLASRTGLSGADVDAVLAMNGASPVAVWAVRDVLNAVVREIGASVEPWSVLTDAARVRAQQWFSLKDVA